MNPQASNEVTADQILAQINELPISLNASPTASIPGTALAQKYTPTFFEKYGIYMLGGLVLLAIVTKH